MALMIPESLENSPTASEQRLFALLRRFMPDTSIVWHRQALEVEPEQAVPFVMLDDAIGIAMVIPLDWPQLTPMEILQLQEGRFSGDEQLAACYQMLTSSSVQSQKLLNLIIESEMPALVTDQGTLRPKSHLVFVLSEYSTAVLNKLGLRSLGENGLVVAESEIEQLYQILCQATPAANGMDGDTFNMMHMVLAPSVEIARPVGDPRAAATGETVRATSVPLMLDPYQEQIVKSYAYIPDDQETLARELDTRLLRGVAGSGKSLILLHRAKYLSQVHSDWRIVVLTYTRSLVQFLRSRIRDLPQSNNIEILTFHSWCRSSLHKADLWRRNELKKSSKVGLVTRIFNEKAINITGLDSYYLRDEIEWIFDNNLLSWPEYASVTRQGRKRGLTEAQRAQIWKLFTAYRAHLEEHNQLDWTEVPILLQEGIAANKIAGGKYEAILVDEAQDFAPSWFHAIQKMLNPQTNMLFIASDVAQKIYRQALSWRSIGINVVGNRSRILERSYRNTYEILSRAHELVGDPTFHKDLEDEEDRIINPELDRSRMRRGPDPYVFFFGDTAEEYEYILQEVMELHQEGCAWQDIAIFHSNGWQGVEAIGRHLQKANVPVQISRADDINLDSPDVKLTTLYSAKGLEFTNVFIAGVDKLQPRAGLTEEELSEAIAQQRRLLYVGMTRARQRLYVTYVGALPSWAGSIGKSKK